jgi:antitoxin (DNA-binding transcriptional repressor) of toxin-antitoxin stability system
MCTLEKEVGPMKASILDLRRRMSEVLRALDQNEPVTIFYRGKKKAVLYPAEQVRRTATRVSEHRAFAMWRDREDMQDVGEVVRRLRKTRLHAL